MTVVPGKGIMIAMNHRLVKTVVNRCKPPADGDILVPIRTVCVIGTTDMRVVDPDELEVTQPEVDQMLDEGEKLVPGFREARALRVWAGARPLFSHEEVADTREVSRSHALLDHREARRHRGLRDDYRRQDHDVPAHGRGGGGRRLRSARGRAALPDARGAAAGLRGRPFYDLGSRLRAREPVPSRRRSSASAS